MSGITVPPSNPPDLADAGGRALKLQTDTPHLVSMGGDRLSTSVTLHPLPPGRLISYSKIHPKNFHKGKQNFLGF